MLQLRRALASSAHYHAEATKLLIACRDRRDRQNRQFAEALAGDTKRPSHEGAGASPQDLEANRCAALAA